MTHDPQFLPPPKTVVLLLPPCAQLIGVVGFLEVFDAANRVRVAKGRPAPYRLVVAGVEPVTSSAAGAVLQPVPVADVPHADLVVVGGADLDGTVDPRILHAVGRLGKDAEVVSVCVGAFVLGELGWLDGRRCTTHWLALDALRERFPAALVENDVLFTQDGPVATSAGASAGIDLALHLVRRDLGGKMARFVARTLVVFAQRPGGQSQFGTAFQLRPTTDARLRGLVHHIISEPALDHRVECLAGRVGMSPRHFARVFRDQTGETPAAFVARARVEAAQRALGCGDDGLDAIAASCGFGTVETFRRTFVRVTGVTPGAWRSRFRWI